MNYVDFEGCKLALLHNGHLLVYLRDDKPDIPFPAMLDLPGGQRSINETPEACVLRELKEEFGVSLSVDRLLYRHCYHIPHSGAAAYFFAAKLLRTERGQIRFGEEGQYYLWMELEKYLAHTDVISHHKEQLRKYLSFLKTEAN